MKLEPDWKQGWRYYSTWAFASLLAFPDLYTLLTSWQGWGELPTEATWIIRGLALIGLVVRFIAQQRPESAA